MGTILTRTLLIVLLLGSLYVLGVTIPGTRSWGQRVLTVEPDRSHSMICALGPSICWIECGLTEEGCGGVLDTSR